MVAYYRVSTDQQGRSGLGIEAQKAAVAAHIAEAGCDLVGEYTECETGKKHSLDNRPQLRKAVAHAKRSRAILVVARLDRLVRSTVVLSLLKTSGVKFVCCDMPSANVLTIDILAAVAEEECRAISARTKAALAAYKRRGGKLGASLRQCRNLTAQARRKGAKAAGLAVQLKANEAYSDIADDIRKMRDAGLSLMAIARRLNDLGHTTRRERPWNPVQVRRVLMRDTA
jgi:DNA invertase Pin-like site-specific DNA recombinase